MTPVHFQANFLPKLKKFKVEVSVGNHRWVELMTIARYLRWARDLDTKPMKIGGTTVNIIGQGNDGRRQIVEYFQQMAETYKDVKGYRREKSDSEGQA